MLTSTISDHTDPEPVKETLHDANLAVGLGYGESKWVTEQLFHRATEQTGLRTTAVRVGQVSGDQATGGWNTTEWVAALVRVSQDAYNDVIGTYQSPIVALMELTLVAVVLYHGLNGVRIILVDFWSKGCRYQRQMLWTVGVIWIVVMIPATFRIIQQIMKGIS